MKRLPRRRHPRGFTLLEALLALVLLAVLFAVLLPTLSTGARSWSAAEARLEKASAQTRGLDVLRRLLEQARPLPRSVASEDEGLAFRGQPAIITFVAALPAYRSGGGLQVIRLGTGELDGRRGLVLDWQPYHPKVPMRGGDGGQGRREMLLEGVREVRFAYRGRPETAEQPGWYQAWEQPRLPQLIQVRLALAGGATREVFAAPEIGRPEEAGMEGPLP